MGNSMVGDRATSFRMLDGRVRNLDGHLRRLGLNAKSEKMFLSELRRQFQEFAAQGNDAANPIVYVSGDQWRIMMRPDRPFESLIMVDAVGHLDERSRPLIKGPDLSWLSTRMEISRSRGADEGILVDRTGNVVEGIFSHIVAFSDGQAIVSGHSRTMPSVTAEQVLSELRGRRLDISVRSNGFMADELMDAEVWFLNAFSGIRRVAGWVGKNFRRCTALDHHDSNRRVPDYRSLNRRLWEMSDVV